ncbi:hypothetical protein GCM10023238_34020 [Streptomyces heliomycini]
MICDDEATVLYARPLTTDVAPRTIHSHVRIGCRMIALVGLRLALCRVTPKECTWACSDRERRQDRVITYKIAALRRRPRVSPGPPGAPSDGTRALLDDPLRVPVG